MQFGMFNPGKERQGTASQRQFRLVKRDRVVPREIAAPVVEKQAIAVRV